MDTGHEDTCEAVDQVNEILENEVENCYDVKMMM